MIHCDFRASRNTVKLVVRAPAKASSALFRTSGLRVVWPLSNVVSLVTASSCLPSALAALAAAIMDHDFWSSISCFNLAAACMHCRAPGSDGFAFRAASQLGRDLSG